MQRVERRARIEASPDQLFAYLADLDNVAEWQSGVVSAEVVGDGGLGVGARARVVRELMGQRIEAPLTVAEYDPPRHLAITSEVSGVGALAVLDIAGDDAGSVVDFAMEIRGSGLTRFMEPMIAGAAGGDIDASLRRLQERFAKDR